MLKNAVQLTLLISSLVVAACGTDSSTSTASRAIIDTPCATDTECPAGFECEVEDEHGTVTSFCQADEDNAGTCPAGYELEVEHGQSFCKPHGGGDGSGSGSGAGSGSDDTSTGTGTLGTTCASDADCTSGLECEIEVEHGTTTATCQPHGNP